MLKYLTLTGIDERTDIGELVKLQDQYPALEYGVLVSTNNTGVDGKNRYPGLDKVYQFADAGLRMSCHFCGSLAYGTMKTGNFDAIRSFIGDVERVFQRMQFNINGTPCSSVFKYQGSIPIIIQAGTKEGEIFFKCMNICNAGGIVQGLVDHSGGRGKFRGYFEVNKENKEFVGYAGGLGVDNLSRVLIDLRSRLGEKDFWVDMESSLRTNDWFDVSIARRVCEIAFGD